MRKKRGIDGDEKTARGLPPVDVFWSISMTDAKNRMVSNPINRTASATAQGSYRTPTVRSTSISRIRPRPATNRTGCRRRNKDAEKGSVPAGGK